MTKESFMIEEISKDIVLLLMKEHDMSMQEAIHALYTSDTYDRLSNLHTGLYTQSAAYVYEYLEKESLVSAKTYQSIKTMPATPANRRCECPF